MKTDIKTYNYRGYHIKKVFGRYTIIKIIGTKWFMLKTKSAKDIAEILNYIEQNSFDLEVSIATKIERYLERMGENIDPNIKAAIDSFLETNDHLIITKNESRGHQGEL